MQNSSPDAAGRPDGIRLWSNQMVQHRPPRFRFLDLHNLLDEVLCQLSDSIANQRITLTVDVPSGLSLLADDNMLRTAAFQLLLNAIQAMPDGGELVITAVQGRAGIELEIADSGPGLPNAKSLLHSTRTADPSSGLAVIQDIAEAHGGCVTAMNCPEGGAAFTLQFPVRAARAAA